MPVCGPPLVRTFSRRESTFGSRRCANDVIAGLGGASGRFRADDGVLGGFEQGLAEFRHAAPFRGFDPHVVSYWNNRVGGSGPQTRVENDSLYRFVMVGRRGFVPRSKIKDLTAPSLPAASTSEHFTTVEPTYNNKFIRCRNLKFLSIHLLQLEFYVSIDALCYRMRPVDSPNPLAF